MKPILKIWKRSSRKHGKKKEIPKEEIKQLTYNMVTRLDLDLKKKRHKNLIWFVFLFSLLWIKLKMILKAPLYKNGIHCVVGDTGGGKSLIAHKLATYYLNRGYKVVSNSKFNNRMTVIDIADYFNEFEQKKPLKNCIVIFDEIQRQFNRRQNKKNDYNEIFIPMIEWLTTHRHQGVPKVIFLTQSYNQLDLQLQNLIHRVHFVYTKEGGDYDLWLKRKSLRAPIRPKAIFYYSKRKKDIDANDIQKYIQNKENRVYNRAVKRNGNVVYKPTPKYKEIITLEDLATFDTYAFKREKIEKKVVASIENV